MTPYVRFHPGGLKYIMMGAGRDATSLFNKFHAWVNIDFMMDKCMVGLLESPADRVTRTETETSGVSESAQLPEQSAAVTESATESGSPVEKDRMSRLEDGGIAPPAAGCRGGVEKVEDQAHAIKLIL